MQENIYTIPLNDILAHKCGCPICRLEKIIDNNTLSYCMGAAMMETDVRIKTNKLGFCKSHLNSMLSMKNRLSLALLLKSHIIEVDNKDFFCSSTCFICHNKLASLEKMIINITHLYSTDIEFKNNLLEQEFFCLPHYNSICKISKKHLNRKKSSDFIDKLKNINKKYYGKLSDNLDEYCKLYDYKNSNKNFNNENINKSLHNIIIFLTSDI